MHAQRTALPRSVTSRCTESSRAKRKWQWRPRLRPQFLTILFRLYSSHVRAVHRTVSDYPVGFESSDRRLPSLSREGKPYPGAAPFHRSARVMSQRRTPVKSLGIAGPASVYEKKPVRAAPPRFESSTLSPKVTRAKPANGHVLFPSPLPPLFPRAPRES